MTNPVKMQRHAINDCSRGDPRTCIAAPVAMRSMALFAVRSALLMVPLAAAIMQDSAYDRLCNRSDDAAER